MASTATWATFNGWSGPRVRGTCRWSPPAQPDGLHLILAAIAEPEGGCYDSVYSCDGTGATWGFLQWTLTSGRLQRLLTRTSALMGGAFRSRFSGPLFDATGIHFDAGRAAFIRGGKALTSKADIRAAFTPPDGHCPRTGADWITAQAIARLFADLGKITLAQRAQREFAEAEIAAAIGPKRPFMGGRRIAEWLYLDGWERGSCDDVGAVRALFWSMWQNSPRKAEEYLSSMSRPVTVDAIARKFGLSSYARWGVRKAARASKPYTSRYEKSALVINRLCGQVVLPELWR